MMTDKTKKSVVKKSESYPRKNIVCHSGSSLEERGRNFAKLITSPEVAACRIVGLMQPKSFSDEIDTPTLIDTLRDQTVALQGGDLTYAESMLLSQASSLQALFVRLTERAIEQSQMSNIEGFMKLALRAQSQCRATLETLAAIKNPPIIYAKQANVTSGPQQINNGSVESARVQEIENEQTQLSGENLELHQNTRASSPAFRNDQALETMGEINGAKDIPRQRDIS
jgi:hypothetical protein